MLKPGKSMNLTQQIAHHLGLAIVGGEYGHHNPVPSEAELCKQLNVSRSAAREAVKSLAAKGLLSSRARQGISVLPESSWNLFDVDVLTWIRESSPSLVLLKEFTELRLAVEPQAARLASGRATAKHIEAIQHALERMQKAETGVEDPLEADIAFHAALLDASGNRFFAQLSRIIDTTLRVSIRFTNKLKGVKAAAYQDHRAIYDAVVASDPVTASARTETLILEALSLIDSALAERGDAQ